MLIEQSKNALGVIRRISSIRLISYDLDIEANDYLAGKHS
jgi:hypothetical protein